MTDLTDVATGQIVDASRQNLINDYIQDGTHKINTLSIDIGGTEIIDSSRVVITDSIKRSSGDQVINTDACRLTASGLTLLSWGSQILYGAAGNISIDWTNQKLYSEFGIHQTSIDWANRHLTDSSLGTPIVTVDWADQVLNKSYISTTQKSLDWYNRYLYAAGNTITFDWQNLKFPTLTSNGFLKTSSSNGTLTVDTTSYVPYTGATASLDLGGTLYSVKAKTAQVKSISSYAGLSGGGNIELTMSVLGDKYTNPIIDWKNYVLYTADDMYGFIHPKFDWGNLKFPSLTTNGLLKVSSSNGTIGVDTNSYSAITNGTSAPSSTPSKIGDIYVDTSAKKIYVATGTSSSSDWTIIN